MITSSICENLVECNDSLNDSNSLNKLCQNYRKQKISICKQSSGCSATSKNSTSSSETSQKCKGMVPTCVIQSICDNAWDKYKSMIEDCKQTCAGDAASSICMNQSVCGSMADDSTASDDDFDEICAGRKKSSNCTICENYTVCDKVSRDQDSFAEELLKQLPSTKHTDESQRHWEMMLHCERAAFPRATSNLHLSSRDARFYWHLYSTATRNSCVYQKDVNHALLVTLSKLVHSHKQKTCINIWDQLIRLKTFDPISRENLINRLAELLYKQNSLESICLEGLSLKPDEGIRLLTALYNSRETMKYVYCWRAFEKMVGISTDDHYQAGTRFYREKKIEKCDWFRAIGCLECLTTLSINYAYIATPTGDLLVTLAKKLQRNWQWLQLLCLEEEIVQRCSLMKDEVVMIPEKAWKKAHLLAPALKIQYAIIGIPKFHVHKKFLTKYTRTHTFSLSTGIDLKFGQPWCLDSTIKILCSWYPNTLVYLYLQLWHNRENLDIQLKKLFLDLPSLQVFEYIGEIRKLKTLCAMCCQIRSGSCNIYSVNMKLQKVLQENIDEEKWIKSVKCLIVCFKHDFENMGVKFDISFYNS